MIANNLVRAVAAQIARLHAARLADQSERAQGDDRVRLGSSLLYLSGSIEVRRPT